MIICETICPDPANLPVMDNAPPNQQQILDNEHLKLLSIFHYVVSGLAAFFACIPIIHLVIGLFFILAPQKLGPGSNGYIQIWHVGKRLTDYKMMRQPGQKAVRTQATSIDTLEEYLKENEAVLVR